MDISNVNDLSAVDTQLRFMQSTIIKVNPLQIKNGVSATLAASCLVQPEVGDIVACITDSSGDVYILSILKRLNPDADLVVSLSTPVSVRSPRIHLAAQQIELLADEMTGNIGVLKRLIGHAEDIVGNFVASFDKIFIRANSSIRRVEDLDELSAGHVKIDSPALVEISGEVTTISGEELIKLQGQQIHMG